MAQGGRTGEGRLMMTPASSRTQPVRRQECLCRKVTRVVRQPQRSIDAQIFKLGVPSALDSFLPHGCHLFSSSRLLPQPSHLEHVPDPLGELWCGIAAAGRFVHAALPERSRGFNPAAVARGMRASTVPPTQRFGPVSTSRTNPQPG